jgi:hypothetical protein
MKILQTAIRFLVVTSLISAHVRAESCPLASDVTVDTAKTVWTTAKQKGISDKKGNQLAYAVLSPYDGYSSVTASLLGKKSFKSADIQAVASISNKSDPLEGDSCRFDLLDDNGNIIGGLKFNW